MDEIVRDVVLMHEIRSARQRNRERDAIERKNGLAAPGDCPPDEQIRTAMSALGCALQIRSWDEVAEAYVLLQDLHKQHFDVAYGVDAEAM